MTYKKKLESLKDQSLYREIRKIEKLEDKYLYINGQKYLDFSSSNYLGLRDDKRVVKAVKKALDIYGFGSGASRLVVGNSKIFDELEELLAELKGKEKALIFNSGYDLNLGVISSITDENSYIFCDKLNHASIYDGINLSKANLIRFKHNDMADLEKKLEKYIDKKDKLLVTDTVFSMDGDRAKLKEIVELKEKYGFKIMVDEAHAGGVLGTNGMGLVEELGLTKQVDIIMGTFSKAYGGQGAYVAGSEEFINFLINTTRSLIYTTALPPCIVAGNLEAIKISLKEKFRKVDLEEKSEYLREKLINLGYNIGESTTQIIPVMMESNEEALYYHKKLIENAIYLPAIRKPTVVKPRLRVSLGYNISKEDIDCLIENLKILKENK